MKTKGKIGFGLFLMGFFTFISPFVYFMINVIRKFPQESLMTFFCVLVGGFLITYGVKLGLEDKNED